MTSTGLYWRTLRYLKPQQLVYQVWNRLRSQPRLQPVTLRLVPTGPTLSFPVSFTCLNQSVTFTNQIDWNYARFGKLWTYTLTYFDWLDSRVDGLALIHDFIRQTTTIRDGFEPYPTSLRLLNWRAFVRGNGIHDPLIEQHLYQQTALLRTRLEYHLGGNHLLENACALTVMAIHFRHRPWFTVGAALLRAQLAEQILTDGGHYERSPVYHQLLTDRLLTVYETLQADTWSNDPDLGGYVQEKVAAMLNWLVTVTFRDGSVPMVNDAAHGIALTTAQLLAKARPLNFVPAPVTLTDSGYRMLTTDRLELFIDVGPVGPDHQPGHAHADTFSFILHVDGQPLVVDPGTSTYRAGERRSWERSTAAHNTVTVGGHNSSEVWSTFRLGRRAQVQLHTDTSSCVEATHTGYAHLTEQHTRRWTLHGSNTLTITDHVSPGNQPLRAHLYFAHQSGVTVDQQIILVGPVTIHCTTKGPPPIINQASYDHSLGFNHTVAAPCVSLDFSTELTTHFST
ncbi:alginate lyase family protein [Fibrella sp. USSR17]